MDWMYAIDPETGDYLLDEQGRLVKTSSPALALYRAIDIPLGSFFADPDDGSRIAEILGGPPRAPEEMKAALERAAREAIGRLPHLVTLRAVTYDAERRTLTIDTDELPNPIDIKIHP